MLTSETYNYARPALYPKQWAAIIDPVDLNGDPARISILEASTKSGKTAGCIIWLFEQAFIFGKSGQNYWWVAPVYKMAEIAYTRLVNGIDRSIFKKNDSELTVTLINGTKIWFKSGEKPDNLFGEDVYAAVIDEASRLRKEAWYAIRTTLTATRGPLRIITNVKGRKNWSYRLARRAEAGEPGYSYHKITAADAVAAGVLDADEVAEAKRDLPEDVFLELYEAEASEDGGNPFGLKSIGACIRDGLSSGPVVAWGWDLAKSVDWTVGTGLNKDGGVAEFHRFQKPWRETKEKIKKESGSTFGLVDSTGVGDPIVEEFERDDEMNLQGYQFTQRSKQQLMEGLAVAIQSGETEYPEGVISVELESFEFVYSRVGVSYSAPVGMHDDCVCSIALAAQALRSIPAPVEAW